MKVSDAQNVKKQLITFEIRDLKADSTKMVGRIILNL